METWTLDSAIEYYAKFGESHSHYAKFTAGMIQLLEQIKIAEDLPPFSVAIVKLGLFLRPADIPANIPSWFTKSISIGWVAPNHYEIGLIFHERLLVPAEMAIETVKYQFRKVKRLVDTLNFSAEEVEEWEKRYRTKNREDIEFLYSRQPHEWLLSNVSLDIQNQLTAITRRASKLHFEYANDQIDESKTEMFFDDVRNIIRNIQNILEVAEELESKYQTDIYLQNRH